MNSQWTRKPANRTRRTSNLQGKFIRERHYHLLPVYHLLRMSDFAREGIENSGSYRFADHLYRNQASGRTMLGRMIDRVLLNLPAARAMRRRCYEASTAMYECFMEHTRGHDDCDVFRVLTVPCGIPRDVRDFALKVQQVNPAAIGRIAYTAMDIDAAALSDAHAFLRESPLRDASFVSGDALRTGDYPVGAQHFVASTGLGEFLGDADLLNFYGNVHSILASGGTFFTSATACEKHADALLRTFELDTHYRTHVHAEQLLRSLTWKSIEITRDPSGLQTFVRAVKR